MVIYFMPMSQEISLVKLPPFIINLINKLEIFGGKECNHSCIEVSLDNPFNKWTCSVITLVVEAFQWTRKLKIKHVHSK